MAYDEVPTNIPTTPLRYNCACCGRVRPMTDRIPTGAPGRFVCGNCDANEEPSCPNCGNPWFGGVLAPDED